MFKFVDMNMFRCFTENDQSVNIDVIYQDTNVFGLKDRTLTSSSRYKQQIKPR